MARKYLAFDIEVATEFPIEAADWSPYRPLGISCAATVPSDGPPRTWHGVDARGLPADRMSRREAAAMVEHLASMAGQGYTVLTWNGLGFDFDVLAEESGMAAACRELAAGHVDMMFHAFCQLGHPVGLDAAAKAMRLPGKPEGLAGRMMPGLWAEGKREEVLQYVVQDARTTLDLAVACQRQGRLRWISRRGAPKEMPLPSGWLEVSEARKLPEPDTSWMNNPIPRSRFTAWLRAGG
jgi:hypothetical protein